MKDRTDLLGVLLLILPLLVAISAANVPDPRLNRRHCSTFYEHAGTSPTTTEGIEFAGVVEHGGGSSAPHVGVFDTPLYDDANIAEATLVGRLMGSFWPHESDVGDEAALHSGLWNFHFFESGGWISASLGFGPNNTSANTPNVVTGGTGEYSGYIGTVEHSVVKSNPFVVEYMICPPSPFAVMEIETKCVDVFTWDSSQPSVIANRSFAGDVFRGDDSHVGVLDNPAFLSLEAAQGQNMDENVVGRNIGVYFPNSLRTSTALFNFEFFGDDDDEVDWIATSFGFSFETPLGTFTTDEQPNVIIGGSGKYSGIVGTIKDTVEEFIPVPEGAFAEVNYYTICSDDDPFPNPIVEEDCTAVFEVSKPESFAVGGYNFSGSILVGEDYHLGIFDTPFFLSSDVENSTVAGRIMGHYFLNERGAATGQWNFHFFGRDDNDEVPSGWLTGNLGFGEGDYPNVVVGGTGDWKGFQGRIRPTPLSAEVFRWTICPEGVETIVPTGQPAIDGSKVPTIAPEVDEEEVNLPTTSAAATMMKYMYVSAVVPCMLCWASLHTHFLK